MRLFSIFRRKPESAAEKQALANLDEETRAVAWDEFEKEGVREHSGEVGPMTLMPGFKSEPLRHEAGDPVPEPVDDPDPASAGGLRDALHEDEKKN